MREKPKAWIVVALSVVGAFAATAGAGRYTDAVCLNGEWQFQPSEATTLAWPPGGEWAKEPIRVPGWWDHADFGCPAAWRSARSGWYRRTFRVPAASEGSRVRLRFDAVYYEAQVFVNGTKVGFHRGGYTPFAVDVTDAVTREADNELLVAVVGWHACLTPEWRAKAPRQYKHVGRGGVVYPWGFYGSPGIWQDVWLETLPPAHLDNLAVRTLGDGRQLKALCRVSNPSKAPVTGTLSLAVFEDDGRKLGTRVAVLGERRVALKAREGATVELAEAVPALKLWWPHAPALYWLEARLAVPGHRPQVVRERFGCRTFAAKGDLFTLNGTPMRLRVEGRCTWWPTAMLSSQIRAWYRMCRMANCNGVRLHAGKFSREFLRIADEMGFLVIVESAPLWCLAQQYAFTDPRLTESANAQIRERIDQLENHPSLAIWSIENELLMTGGHKVKGADQQVAGWGRLTKRLDPTRPIMYEADADVLGTADVINLHYPYEYPRHTHWPDAAWWLEANPGKIDVYPFQFTWHRKKPLCIGEFLSNWCSTADTVSVMCGDDAYRGREGKIRGWARAVRMQLVGYRMAGCTSVNPWCTLVPGVKSFGFGRKPLQWPDLTAPGMKPLHLSHGWTNPGVLPGQPLVQPNAIFEEERRAFSPIAAFIKEYDTRFFAGDKVTRTIVVMNDTLHDAPVTVDVRLELGGREPLPILRRAFALRPGQIERVVARFTAPAVAAVARGTFQVAVRRDRDTMFDDRLPAQVFPKARKRRWPLDGVVLVDGGGETAGVLAALGLPFRRVTTMADADLGTCRLLIIGEGSLPADVGRQRERIAAFVRGGGDMLCFEQEAYPHWLPLRLKLDTRSPCSIAFPRGGTHPITKGLSEDDLSFWRGDHLVCTRNIVKPPSGPFLPLIDSGTRRGLTNCALGEIRWGMGRYLLCQAHVIRKFATEPTAARLLEKMLEYLASPAPQQRPLFVIDSAEHTLAGALRAVGAAFTERSPEAPMEKLPSDAVLLVAGDPFVWAALPGDALGRFVQRGGTLWVQGAGPMVAKPLARLVGSPVRLRGHGRFKAALGRPATLTCGLSSHDLYWIESERWDTGPVPSAAVAEYAIEPTNGLRALTEPGILAEAAAGKGRIVLDQIRWAEAMAVEPKTKRVASVLLANLGVATKPLGEARPKAGDFFAIGIARQCNMGFADDVAGDGKGGWTDQGKGWDMARFPVGRQRLAGVPFDVIDPAKNDGRSCIVLRSPKHARSMPKAVAGIPVGRKASELWFVQAAAWSLNIQPGEAMGRYTVHYADGSQAAVPIRFRHDVTDWFFEPEDLPNAEVAWVGSNEKRGPIAIYAMPWANPHPDKAIASLSMASAEREPIPICIAITGNAAPSTRLVQPRAKGEPVAKPIELAVGPLKLRVTPQGAFQPVAAGGTVLLDEVALRVHNNELGHWHMLAAQSPVRAATLATTRRRVGVLSALDTKGGLGYLDVEQQALVADEQVFLRYRFRVARPVAEPEKVMGVLVHLGLPAAWAGATIELPDGTRQTLHRECRPENRLSGTHEWAVLRPADPRLPAIRITTPGRWNLFDSRFFDKRRKEPLYVLQLFPSRNPTERGATFELSIGLEALRTP